MDHCPLDVCAGRSVNRNVIVLMDFHEICLLLYPGTREAPAFASVTALTREPFDERSSCQLAIACKIANCVQRERVRDRVA